MRDPVVNDIVILAADVPELCLHRGQSGVIRSLWAAHKPAYEVEFTSPRFDSSSGVGLDEVTRAVLLREQLVVTDESSSPTLPQQAIPSEGYELGIW